jgi:hypothetical protein
MNIRDAIMDLNAAWAMEAQFVVDDRHRREMALSYFERLSDLYRRPEIKESDELRLLLVEVAKPIQEVLQ